MRGRSSHGWEITLIELLLCFLLVIIALVSTHKADDAGIKPKAEYVITAEWSLDSDADVDLWGVPPPGGQPVFYKSREQGLLVLDQDCLGFPNTIVSLDDGSQVKMSTCKETMSLRGIVPGHYDFGVNLFAYRESSVSTDPPAGIKVHVEIIQMNPRVKVVYVGDVSLDHQRQTINFASFDLARDGSFKRADPPLEPITDLYFKQPSGADGG
jgi:hypothetical protein